MVLIGLLIGGAVPFLFSSMLIRAVGRAAFFIVKECRVQFKDPAIMAGTKKPDYGRVVDICTNTAQKELIGPGLLAIAAPFGVGFLLGPYALGGFLAGMILVGQLLAVFMANAGGAWDNAKKMIEDGLYGGKGSEAHKASRHRRHGGRPAEGHRRAGHQPDGQGDEHGQPAGPRAGADLQRGRRPSRRGKVQTRPSVSTGSSPTCRPIGTSASGRGRGLRVVDYLGGVAEQERVGRDEGDRRQPGRRRDSG